MSCSQKRLKAGAEKAEEHKRKTGGERKGSRLHVHPANSDIDEWLCTCIRLEAIDVPQIIVNTAALYTEQEPDALLRHQSGLSEVKDDP